MARSEYLGLLAVLALLVLLFGSLSERFLTLRTFTTVANQVPDLAVVAVGMTFVLIVGGIDLSVGSVLALAGAVMGVALVEWNLPLGAGALAALGAGLICGFLNGFASVWWSIPSFIVTLGMLEVSRGAAYLVTDSKTAYIGTTIEPIGAPLPVIGLSPAFLTAVLLVAAGQLVLSRTVFGKYAVAIGTNEEAVRLSGVDPRPTRIAVFALAGLLSGLGGIFHAARLVAADPNAAVGLELSAIAAVVLGGTSLLGGRGSVVRSFFGVLVIAVLQSGLAQIGASEPTKRVVTGVVIVAAVIADSYRSRRAAESGPILVERGSAPRERRSPPDGS
ncbi:MAG: ABC transporter permease [Vicinamibacteria bacterium]